MQKMLISGRMALITTLLITMSACSSNEDRNREIAEAFAQQRAEMLERVIPIELDGYNLLRSKAKGTQIVLTLIYTGAGNGNVSPLVLADSLQQTYCSDPEIVSILEKGVMYKLLFRNSRGKPILERTVAINDCLDTNLSPPELKKAR